MCDMVWMYVNEVCTKPKKEGKFRGMTTSKQAWEILEKSYAGDNIEKMVRLKTHKMYLELIHMEEKEIVSEYARRITRLVNQIKTCGETITEQHVVGKILRSLTSRFDNMEV